MHVVSHPNIICVEAHFLTSLKGDSDFLEIIQQQNTDMCCASNSDTTTCAIDIIYKFLQITVSPRIPLRQGSLVFVIATCTFLSGVIDYHAIFCRRDTLAAERARCAVLTSK